jgi:dephospho-CoA kinase
MFFGSIPAVITPFKNNKVDYESLNKVVEYLISNQSNGLVPCGTTGESPTLSHEEHKKIVEETIRINDKRVPVIAGTGSNNTIEAIEFTQHAEKVGADAVLVVTASELTQKKRVLRRRNIKEQDFQLIKRNQMNEKEKIKRADFLINTDKSLLETKQDVLEIYQKIKGSLI